MREVYDTRAWRKLRAGMLARNPLCKRCEGRGKIVAAEVVDHIVPVSQGGAAFDEENLQCLCKPCHDGPKKAEDNQRRRLAKPGFDWRKPVKHPRVSPEAEAQAAEHRRKKEAGEYPEGVAIWRPREESIGYRPRRWKRRYAEDAAEDERLIAEHDRKLRNVRGY